MASPHLRHRAWTLYLWMAVLAIVLGVLMFVLGGGWHSRSTSPQSPIGLLIPAVAPAAAPLG
jgi:hypothetical protein